MAGFTTMKRNNYILQFMGLATYLLNKIQSLQYKCMTKHSQNAVPQVNRFHCHRKLPDGSTIDSVESLNRVELPLENETQINFVFTKHI